MLRHKLRKRIHSETVKIKMNYEKIISIISRIYY